jgi:hypothetical protein
MLQHLVSKALLSEELADNADALYSQLNGAIHGGFAFFSRGGILQGKASGRRFNIEAFRQWCGYFSKIVAFAIPALRVNVLQWSKINIHSGPVCSICHSRDHLEIRDASLGSSDQFERVNCQKCGNSMTFISGHRSYEVT